MNSFVLAQLHAVGSGAAHHAPAWAPWQRALMAASSSAYLANAVCWSRYDHPILAGVFIAVAILSTAADALSDAVFAPAALARVRTADRAVGSTALVASVVANSLSPVITACATLAALSAVSVLLWARAVARAEPKRWATYLCLQAGWHVYGAAVLCTVTWLAQGRVAFGIGAWLFNALSKRLPRAPPPGGKAALPKNDAKYWYEMQQLVIRSKELTKAARSKMLTHGDGVDIAAAVRRANSSEAKPPQ